MPGPGKMLSQGTTRPVDVAVAEIWDPGFGDFLSNSYHYLPKNLDHNSGSPIGISVCQLSTHNGKRVTASGAYLASIPPNLTIMTEATVTRILTKSTSAVRVEAGRKQLFANQEVILAAGAVDSPKLLLLSGIGSAKDLEALSIPVVHDLPGVGKNLQDRLFLEGALEEARTAWLSDRSGPLAKFYLPQMIAYLKGDIILSSKEFDSLDSNIQQLLRAETNHIMRSSHVKPPEDYLATAVAFPGSHGTGVIELQSSNPNDPPLIDPKFLEHPFDQRLAIESVRETLEFLNQPLMAKDTLRFAAGPSGDTDEAILAYVRKTATSMWHTCGTVKMGKIGDQGTCVDKDFKVVGMQNLRVVDMSVVPFLPRDSDDVQSAHLQAVAYLVGETAAEKIIGSVSR
ncbi:MAG: hypothetical protein Q9195_005804 [Heterodermia aff. obscurata]